MKKNGASRIWLSAIVALLLVPAALFAQQGSASPEQDAPEPPKYALVIGNGAYSGGLSRLANPVNDANDISAVLEHLGFNVDKVLDGSLEQMEEGVNRLKNRLSASEDSYGFFFYAGHGVQSGGENFLVPVNANIPGENYLRSRALSMQIVLDDLNDAKNGLNVVVLDACRDNPFGWSRSGSRGLAIVSRQPADSIIVYATSAGQRASDGDGRNGLFTSQLLNNLATPGLEVTEIFRRTGSDVAQISNNEQIPAIYSQFFGTAYLGGVPIDFEGYIVPPSTTVIIGGREREPAPAKLWSVGASVGSSFAAPWLIGTVRGTIAPFNHAIVELGMDMGFVSNYENSGYSSFTPYINAAYYRPFLGKFGWYAGLGAGFMIARYTFEEGQGYPEGEETARIFAGSLVAGVNILDMIDVSYTFRTNFKGASNKLSVGYFWRFK